MEFLEFLSQPSVPVAIVEILIGLFLLSKAADVFVDGAAEVAVAAKMSPVVIGAVVVGFGTSAPELLVSGIAASGGDADLGLGNIVGSNVANISLVLACAALVTPILVTRAVLVREAPLSVASVCLFAFFTIGGFAVWEGIVMLAVLVAVLGWIVFGGNEDSIEEVEIDADRTIGQSLGLTLVGLVGTVLGAQFMVWGAQALGEAIGLPSGFIGFTVIAIGTSLPELVTAFAAAKKGETELILGNLLGSNMFNSLAVGGAVAILGAGEFEGRIPATYGVVIMVIIAALTWVFMVTRRKITRTEAVVLLGAYVFAILLIDEELGIGDSIRDVIGTVA